MKRIIFNTLLLLILVLTACTPTLPGSPTATPLAGGTPTLRDPLVQTTSSPDPTPVARAFLQSWVIEDYNQMYDSLTRVSRDAITREKFEARFLDISYNLTLKKLEYEVLSSLVNSPRTANVAYRLTFNTTLAGIIKRETAMTLSMEDGSWKVQWDDGLIMPELKGGNRLTLDYKIPTRGDIYDRQGLELVTQSEAYAIGVIPGQITEGTEKRLLAELAELTGKPQQWIKAMYENAVPSSYVPIGEAPKQQVDARGSILNNLPGLQVVDYKGRFYYNGGVAPHVVGYVQAIPREALTEYRRNGYRGDEKVGMSGLEKWAENQLAGQRGASLYVVDPNGSIITRLAQVDSAPSQSITTTLDKNLQIAAQKAIEGFRGAIVVLERDTGRVLAMVSTPGFDPNAFEPTSFNSFAQVQDLVADTRKPLLNRATQGLYPMGSIFKIITMAAALETGLYTPETKYNCGYTFTELPGVTLYDWTYEKQVPASGELTLSEALMRSCNTYFYHVGLDLYRRSANDTVTKMAAAFGLGKATGIGQVAEEDGQNLIPENERAAVQVVFGQGAVLATPLQVATFIAAVGNGGTLYRPQVVEKMANLDGVASQTFKPEVNGTLPLKPENLAAIQAAMRSVVENRRGTGWSIFTGLGVPVAGKTGTATNPFGNSHAWFAGYTYAGRADKPDIAMVVLTENAGEGSEISGPIFRRVVENYFYGRPSALYWWESTYYVTRTPAPTATKKP